jgi:small subunit ribosomal protein S18
VIGDFITPFGRIKHNKETGLRLVNQRRMAKTIRRAIGLGIHPSVYRHPMILLKDRKGQ